MDTGSIVEALYPRVWKGSAMALAHILSLCLVLLVTRQVFSESGDSEEQLQTPLEPERGELLGIQVTYKLPLIIY
jgi:hypothetical protein